jgi:hypothetical protein
MERIYGSFLSKESQHISYNGPMTHASLLQELIDLHSALKSDRTTPREERKQRDRKIGQAMQSHKGRSDRQIRGWLGQVSINGLNRQGHQGSQFYRLMCVALVIAGLITGWILAQAVLYYTGDRPINIINALALLVLPQIILLSLWLLASMPWKLPLFESMQSTLGFLNPGRLARHFTSFSSEQHRQSLAVLWDRENMIALKPASHWLFSFWSQVFALSFNSGMLIAAFYMISFSDLAFVWSSTLNLDSAAFHQLLGTLSWPWSELFPAAVPSIELVEVSRYYRLEGGSNSVAAPDLAVHLGQWWPFLLASIACYGFVPRLLTLTISWFRLHHHLRHALPLLPGAPELLARMNSPLISTAALQPEAAALFDSAAAPDVPETTDYDLKCVVIGWSGAGGLPAELAIQLQTKGIETLAFLPAGGVRSMDQDNATITTLHINEPDGVALIVKSWEPPLLELLDFIASIRAQSDHQLPIILLLWGGDSPVSAQQRDTWQVSLRPLKDPNLHVETLGHTT